MFANIKEASDYCQQFGQRLAPEEEFDREEIELVLYASMVDTIQEGEIPEGIKSQVQQYQLEDNEEAMEWLLAQYVPNFYTALDNAVVKFLSPYVLDIPELEKTEDSLA